MSYLLDTHIACWAVGQRARLPEAAAAIIAETPDLVFSVVSLWETAIKAALGRSDFPFEARMLRRGLLDLNILELPILAEHAFAVGMLPPIHRDPFDRMLVAQARSEGHVLLTVDTTLAAYGAAVRVF